MSATAAAARSATGNRRQNDSHGKERHSSRYGHGKEDRHSEKNPDKEDCHGQKRLQALRLQLLEPSRARQSQGCHGGSHSGQEDRGPPARGSVRRYLSHGQEPARPEDRSASQWRAFWRR